ncbi:hypothetical protein ACWATR_20020 [Nostoc sp. UIC 10890]
MQKFSVYFSRLEQLVRDLQSLAGEQHPISTLFLAKVDTSGFSAHPANKYATPKILFSNSQSPVPNTQSPIPNPHTFFFTAR